MPLPADKVLNRWMAGREPASDAEEHSPVMFTQSNILFVTAAPIIASAKFRHGEISSFPRI